MPAMNAPDSATPPEESRRRFLTAGVRYLALGGLGAFAVAETIKGRRLANDPNCVKLHPCADCLEFSSGCEKPKAADAAPASAVRF